MEEWAERAGPREKKPLSLPSGKNAGLQRPGGGRIGQERVISENGGVSALGARR